MGFNPAQARQAGGKFGFGKTAPAAAPTKASQIPASSIPPQVMAQALQMIRQQQAAAKAQSAIAKTQSPAQKLYLAQLKVAQGILFKEQKAQAAASKKSAAAAKKAVAVKTAAAKKAAAAKARNPAAAAKGAAMGRAAPARGQPGKPLAASTSSRAASAKVQSNLAAAIARP
jgi:hypothetical protein